MRQLELPETIRTATIDEIPNTIQNVEWLRKREAAKIVQGYTFKRKNSPDLSFEFYCEINIDNSRLWELFAVLTFTLPEEISIIYSHIDEEPRFSAYIDRSEAIEILTPSKNELTRDGFLEFGAIYHDDSTLIEVFVKKSKFVQYWGKDHETFKTIMSDFGLEQIDDLNFLDEFPLVTIPLRMVDSATMETEDVLSLLDAKFLRSYR